MFHTTASVSIRLTQRGTLCSSPLSNSEWTQDEGHQIVGCVFCVERFESETVRYSRDRGRVLLFFPAGFAKACMAQWPET